MSISKLRGKSALVQNENTKNTTTTAIKGTTTAAAAVPVAGTTSTASSTTITTTNTAQYHGGTNISTKPVSSTTTATTTTSITAAKLHNPSTASTAAAATSIQQQQQQTYLPQTSLLKIEPFVPSFNARIRRRPIGRSYSTLSSTCIKRGGGGGGVGVGIGFMGNNATHLEGKNTAGILLGTAAVIDSTAAAAATPASKTISRPLGRLRRNPVKIVARQRSKSTSSSASNHRPTTAAAGTTAATINVNHTPNAMATTSTIVNGNGNGNGIAAIVTPQPNGICRIARLPKEQEKLPDRINYDRRGLTSIPIFENEANLRLLSLQHNLINIFHIPKESAAAAAAAVAAREIEETAEAEQASKLLDEINYNINSRNNSRLSRTNSIQGRSTPSNNSSTRLSHTLLGTMNAGSTHILTPPATATAGGSPLTMHPIPIGGSCVGVGNTPHINHLLNRNSILQKKHFNYHSPLLINSHQPHPHPHHHHHHQHQQPQCRFALKKSKSFIANYSRHLNYVKQNLQKSCFLTKTETSNMVASALSASTTNLKSFDSGTSGIDSTSTLLSISEMEATADDCCENARRAAQQQQQQLQLEIKNKQLTASYGEIFQNLVFLDLYDNQIERIGNLDGMPTLSVLLLGKNRIGDISGLVSLRDTLRVLDLHGNKITSISNKINCLQELKSLNLAGNQIRQINQNDFNGLMNLKELNLKRNKIKRINGFQHLVALERLWLCHNDLHKVEDMSSIAKAINLLEVTIENNPVSLAGDCVSFLVSYLPRLQSLSQMAITEQVRRAALAWRKNKEISDANYSHLSTDVFNSIRREEVISNARTNWELLRSQQTVQSTLRNQRTLKQPELAKINESNEAIAVGYEELQDFIKLPPIQQQQQQSPLDAKQHNREGRLSGGSSGSSLGPNVDSSSSNYSSDVEESPKACGEVERARVKKCQKPISMRSRKEKANKLEAFRTSKKQEETQINNASMKCESGTKDLNTIRTPTPLPPSASTNSTTIAAAEDAISKATEAAAATAQRQLTLMNSNQVDNNSSIQSKSNPNITMLPQTDRPTTSSYMLRTTTTITTTTTSSTTLRATTPTTQITGSSSTLSLGFKENNICHNTTTAASSATVPQQQTSATAAATSKATCKRYLKGSLIRSQTVVGGGGGTVIDGAGGKANSSSSHSNANRVANNNNIGLQVQSHQNAATNNANGQTSGSSIVSTILAPAVSLNTNSSKTSANSKAAGANATSSSASAATTTTEREREQGGDYLIEICGRYLNIYGQGALRYIDKQWNPAKANDVHTLNFSYINFNNIAATVLSRIKLRFPHAENFVFRETNISNLGQLNALAELQGITSLCIDPEGNAITTKDLWRQYAIYRLSHWGLKLLNGVEVTDADVDEANCMYAGLSDLVLWSMPEMMLQPLLARLRLDETCTASKMSPKEWLMKADNKSLRLVVGKEALQWKKTNDNNNNHQHYTYDSNSSGGINGSGGGNASSLSATTSMAATASLTVRERGKIHFTQMMLNTCNAVEKLHKLETLWPSLLLDIVRNTLLDYSQLDEYLRNLMSEIMK